MIDIDEHIKSYKCYQDIIDKVTLDECICVALSISIHCNREEMIREAIIQRLVNSDVPRVVVNQTGNNCNHIANVGKLIIK